MSHKYIVDTTGAPRTFGPYSQAVSFGPLLFTSGILPVDKKSGEPLRGGIEAQTKLVLDHLVAILKSSGLSTEHVVKTTVYLRNRNDLDEVDRVYSRYFGYAAPARTVVEVNRLEQDALIVIDAIAVVPHSLESEATHHEVPQENQLDSVSEEDTGDDLSEYFIRPDVQESSVFSSYGELPLGVPFDQEDADAKLDEVLEKLKTLSSTDKSEENQ